MSKEEKIEGAGKKKSLFDICNELQDLERVIFADDQGCDDNEEWEVLAEKLAKATSDFEEKIDSYAGFIRALNDRCTARYRESIRLRDLGKRDQYLVSKLENALKYAFEKRGIKQVETVKNKVSLQNVGGIIPLDVHCDLDINQMSERFVKVTKSINKAAIREALEKGEEVTGCKLLERGQSIRIK